MSESTALLTDEIVRLTVEVKATQKAAEDLALHYVSHVPAEILAETLWRYENTYHDAPSKLFAQMIRQELAERADEKLTSAIKRVTFAHSARWAELYGGDKPVVEAGGEHESHGIGTSPVAVASV